MKTNVFGTSMSFLVGILCVGSMAVSCANAADIVATAVNDLYIVQLKEPALASYQGQLPRLPAPPRDANGRIDMQSVQAKTYLAHLRSQQTAFRQEMEQQLEQTIVTPFQYQHALNGMAMKLSLEQAQQVSKMPQVLGVQPNELHALDTDAGPFWVQAPQLWFGSNAVQPDTLFVSGLETGGGFGEGVVIGVIDSGINLLSNAFSARAPNDGYVHTNPLGAGIYKGWCNPGFAVQDTCNAKLIGAWDFVDTQTPPGATETLGADDENGHGSHTAAISAGNGRVDINPSSGNETRLRGVAPRANLIAYDVCYTPEDSSSGLCPTVSTVAGINQAVADGIVDVINYSISGSANPWTDANEQAFLNATAAGIYVAVSGGNSGRTAGIVAHRSPWTTSVAASTAPKLDAGDYLTVVQPSGVFAPVGMARALGTTPGLPSFSGGPLNGLVTYLPGQIGCNNTGGFPVGSFTGRIALVDLALFNQCEFEEQAINANLAGALAVILLDNVRFPSQAISANVPTQIPVTLLNVGDSQRLRELVQANPNTVRVRMGAVAPFNYFQTSFGDVMAKFSSRGPSPFNDLKPDVTAPGVEIFSADRNNGGSANDNFVLSGTSMSSPHVAGAAALLIQRKPTWTPMQIKSAIVGSAQSAGIVNYDDAPRRQFDADPSDYGAGSVRGARASEVIMTIEATSAEFAAANPANGGLVENLNLPNLTQRNCSPQCSFSRTIKNTSSVAQTVTGSLLGVTGGVTPASFSVAAGASQTVQFQFNTSAVATGSSVFGSATFAAGASTPLRLPISLTVPPPAVTVSPAAPVATVAVGSFVDVPLRVFNRGGPSLNVARVIGVQDGPYLSQLPRLASGQFISSSLFQSVNQGVYVADDFLLRASGSLRRITVPTFSASNLNNSLASVRLRIYANSADLPASNPEATPEQSLWSCELPVGTAGLTISNDFQSNNTVRVNLAQVVPSAQCPTSPNLVAGRYWFSLYGVFADGNGMQLGSRLNWYSGPSTPDSGLGAQVISASGFASGLPNWTAISTLGVGVSPAMAMELIGTLNCDSTLITSVLPSTTTIGANSFQDLTIRISAVAAPIGISTTQLCLQTNDLLRPIVSVPITVQVIAN
jgi:subtilisin family serine protease